MCGRFTFLTDGELRGVVEALEEAQCSADAQGPGGHGFFGAEAPFKLDGGIERAQARPRALVQAVVPHGQSFDIETFSWGFRPTASTDVVFNTRLESALGGTRLWAEPMRSGRCLLPVASFFEPHRAEQVRSPKSNRLVKRQYEFADPQGGPLLLASINDGTSISVLTTKPNETVRPVHARMPLVLRFSEVPLWLEGRFETLSDRSAVQLTATAHGVAASGDAAQLSLF